jgi:fibronectin type 3 domain-containing protein
MKSIFIFFQIVLSCCYLYSQNGSLLTFSTPGAVYLRWQLLPDADLDGYNLYRKTGSGNWQKLNGQPIRMITDVASLQARLGDEAALLLTLLGAEPERRELDRRFLADFYKNTGGVSFLEAISLGQPDYSQALGLTFADTHGQAGGRFQYKITAVLNGRERDWAVSEFIEVGIAQSIPKVENLTGEGSHLKALLSWRKDRASLKTGEIVSYRVYRSTSPGGAYLLVNPGGMLPLTLVAGGQAQQPDREQYLDQTVQNDVTYFYHVRAVNAFGFESQPSETVEIKPGDDRPLSPPAALKARQAGMSVRLSWEAAEGSVRGYEVFKSNRREAGYAKVFPKNDLLLQPVMEWFDWQVNEGGDYYYFVKTAGENNRRSKPSDTLHFFIPDETPPRAPQGLLAKTERGKITLTWQPNREPDLKGYLVERSSDVQFHSRLLLTTNPIDKPTFTDELLPASQTTYGYVVFAIDRAGNRSAPSTLVKAAMPDETPPQAPFIVSLENNGDKVTLGWSKNAEPDVAGYRIYRSPVDSERWQKAGESVTQTFTERLEREGRHRYAVTAVDKAGNESPRSTPKTLTYSKDTAPKPPSSGTAVAKNFDIVLSWKPAAPAPKSYLIRRTEGDGSHPVELAQLPGNAQEFKDVRAATNKEWVYSIIAVDEKWRMSEALMVRFKPKE